MNGFGLLHKGVGQFVIPNNNTSVSETFVIDSSEINLDDAVEVELRIHLQNPDTDPKSAVIYMNPGGTQEPFTGRSIPPGDYTVTLGASDFTNSPYDNYLLGYLRDHGRISFQLEIDSSASANLTYLGSDLIVKTSQCRGLRRWLCLLFCRSCS